MGLAAFAGKLKQLFGGHTKLSDEVFEELGDLLVEGDFGAAAAFHTVEVLQARCTKEKIDDPDRARAVLAELLEAQLITAPDDLAPGLSILLLLGVNGVGKTTSAAKLAAWYRNQGRRPILAAADTFRAAAVDQLKIHGERLGIRVVAHKHGGDPAAVIYDAVESAHAGSGDVIIADTAGRMHTKNTLVEELKKIDRIIESRAGAAQYRKWLVLDSTTGRNALAQAETFHSAVSLDGVVLTKYDSTAKGGAIFALGTSLHLPVYYLCTGEQYTDMEPFNPRQYAREFTGCA